MERPDTLPRITNNIRTPSRLKRVVGGLFLTIFLVFGFTMNSDSIPLTAGLWLNAGLVIFLFIGLVLMLVDQNEVAKSEHAYATFLKELLTPDGWVVEKDADRPVFFPQHFGKRIPMHDPTVLFLAIRQVNKRREQLCFRKWLIGSGKHQIEVYYFDLTSTLYSELPGWVQFASRDDNNQWPDLHDIDLESTEFNNKIAVRSTSARLAFEVLSPDLMHWYLDSTSHPLVFIEKGLLTIMPFAKSIDLQSNSTGLQIEKTLGELSHLRIRIEDLLETQE